MIIIWKEYEYKVKLQGEKSEQVGRLNVGSNVNQEAKIKK
jgi:hypothetical protein